MVFFTPSVWPNMPTQDLICGDGEHTHHTAPHDGGSRGKRSRLLGENGMGDDT